MLGEEARGGQKTHCWRKFCWQHRLEDVIKVKLRRPASASAQLWPLILSCLPCCAANCRNVLQTIQGPCWWPTSETAGPRNCSSHPFYLHSPLRAHAWRIVGALRWEPATQLGESGTCQSLYENCRDKWPVVWGSQNVTCQVDGGLRAPIREGEGFRLVFMLFEKTLTTPRKSVFRHRNVRRDQRWKDIRGRLEEKLLSEPQLRLELHVMEM